VLDREVATLETIQAILPDMRARRSGTIVNISSVGGRVTYPFGTPYHGWKCAVGALSEALHYEPSALGIRVKIIEPGGVRTDFSGSSFAFTNAARGPSRRYRSPPRAISLTLFRAERAFGAAVREP